MHPSRRLRPLALALAAAPFAGFVLLRPSAADPPAPKAEAPSSGTLSDRVVDYRIWAQLDPGRRTVQGKLRARWRNAGTAPTRELRLHLYLNAFKNEQSTFMRESRGEHRRQKLKPGGWGHVDLARLTVDGSDRLKATKVDDTIAVVPLEREVAPGGEATLEIDFTSQLPRVFARTGYHRDFFLVAQWFPKLAVYEGSAWNAHQFHSTTEFYADFGTYEVTLDVPERFVVGATGVPTAPPRVSAGRKVQTFRAADVHDFAWVASPHLRALEGREGNTAIQVLYTPGFERHAARHLGAAQLGLRGFRERLGPYPYPRLTVVNPPPGADGAGGMEYPTFITTFSRWWAPRGLWFPEMVTVHELGHQYFYGILASNEFEHAWMDEGLNTYVTGLVMDEAYGADRSELDLFGLRLGYFAAARTRYRAIAGLDRIDQRAWMYATRTSYGGHTYNKTALVLKTLENHVGAAVMRRALRAYYDRWKFKHPRPDDFVAAIRGAIREAGGPDVADYLDQALSGTHVLDYAIAELASRPHQAPRGVFDGPGGRKTVDKSEPVKGRFDSEVLVRRLGTFVFPVEVEVVFADGQRVRERWDGRHPWKRFEYTNRAELVSARVDPDGKVPLDVSLLNNEKSRKPRRGPVLAMSARLLHYAQSLLSLGGF